MRRDGAPQTLPSDVIVRVRTAGPRGRRLPACVGGGCARLRLEPDLRRARSLACNFKTDRSADQYMAPGIRQKAIAVVHAAGGPRMTVTGSFRQQFSLQTSLLTTRAAVGCEGSGWPLAPGVLYLPPPGPAASTREGAGGPAAPQRTLGAELSPAGSAGSVWRGPRGRQGSGRLFVHPAPAKGSSLGCWRSSRERVVVAEWLRRWTRNPLGSPRAGSNPADYGTFYSEGVTRRPGQPRRGLSNHTSHHRCGEGAGAASGLLYLSPGFNSPTTPLLGS
ncbi:uncharacterized protein LOC124988591 [Sciurus carolinensis]|uniref:uncharacterized protein LOC124988591 n=1 Tax=Sciurus carolinensis TaxID=30640 RepID=UPI001FB54DCA|nr:uncharacterized protein LOC124988591 [Sciurus carolinensis]